MNSIIIAGTQSGSGKTTITISIMKALTKSGKDIAPFKVGPDYIDPKFHTIATGNKSINLDRWLTDDDAVKHLHQKNSAGKDFSIIEGVMGLYDGYNFTDFASTAHISKILKSPVILIVDAKGISASIAAVILGFKLFDKDVNIKGIILNNISNAELYESLKKVIEEKTNIECVGYFPKVSEIDFKSRQLGLIPVEEIVDIEQKIEYLSDIALKTIDLQKIEKIVFENNDDFTEIDKNYEIRNKKNLKIGIAKDQAFSFYYNDNITLLEEAGCEIVYFSPINDKKIPEGLNGIYIGGGFPEEFAEVLSKNKSFIKDLKNKLEGGLPCFAECGGLMYLTEGIVDKAKKFHQTVGFFNSKIKMTEGLKRFGYVEVEFDGIKINAHEFHHSELEENAKPNYEFKYTVRKLNKDKQWDCGLSRLNVIAGYPHFHFYSNFDFFNKIIELFENKQEVK